MAVPALQRLAGAVICGYLRHSPIARGKWRLLRGTLPLVVPIGDGLYVRVLGEADAAGVHLALTGTREPDTMRLFQAVLQPGMTVIDAGANLGEYTLVAARRVGPAGTVHAFEPTPDVVEYLRHNVLLNELQNVIVNAVALSDAPGDVLLHYDPMQPDANSIVSLSHATGVATVPALTLDGYVERAGLAVVDVLKMDVEGAEIMVLTGAARLLAGDAAPVILVEVNEGTLSRSGRTGQDLIHLLQGHGYACAVIDAHGQNARYRNVMAAKPAHVRRFPAVARLIASAPL